MESKKNLTIEELKKQYEDLGRQIEEQEKAEKKAKEEKLKAERQARYNEVVDAYKKFEELRIKYVDDYGYFTFETKSRDRRVSSWILEALDLI